MAYIYLVCFIGLVLSFCFKFVVPFWIFFFCGLIAFATNQIVQIVRICKNRKNAKSVDKGDIHE